MLILTRKIHEAVRIGDDIEVSIIGVKGNQVRLGIKAPSDVAVHREEIYERIHKDEKSSESPGTSEE